MFSALKEKYSLVDRVGVVSMIRWVSTDGLIRGSKEGGGSLRQEMKVYQGLFNRNCYCKKLYL